MVRKTLFVALLTVAISLPSMGQSIDESVFKGTFMCTIQLAHRRIFGHRSGGTSACKSYWCCTCFGCVSHCSDDCSFDPRSASCRIHRSVCRTYASGGNFCGSDPTKKPVQLFAPKVDLFPHLKFPSPATILRVLIHAQVLQTLALMRLHADSAIENVSLATLTSIHRWQVEALFRSVKEVVLAGLRAGISSGSVHLIFATSHR